MKRRVRRESPITKKVRNDGSPDFTSREQNNSSSSHRRNYGNGRHDRKSPPDNDRRQSRRRGSYERDDVTEVIDRRKRYDNDNYKYTEYSEGDSYNPHSGRTNDATDYRGRSNTRQAHNMPAYSSQDRNAGRLDSVFAAAAVAALNAGLGSSSGNDLASIAMRNAGGSNASAVAAVTAAMNAAALAAALSGASPALSAAGLSGLVRPMRTLTANSSNRSSYRRNSPEGETDTRLGKTERRDGGGLSGKIFPHHLDHRDPEDDQSATRTLFIGNLAPDITEADITEIFEKYGFIEDIDIKRPAAGSGSNAYAFLRFVNLDMAHRAKVDMSGRMLGQFTCKIGYGKVTPTRCLWIGGLGPWITYPTFATLLNRFGTPDRIIWPSGKNYAHVLFRNVEIATIAAKTLRGYALGGPDRRVRVDFTDEANMIHDPLVARRKATMASGLDAGDTLSHQKASQRMMSHQRIGGRHEDDDGYDTTAIFGGTRHQDHDRRRKRTSPSRPRHRSSSSHSLSRVTRSPGRRGGINRGQRDLDRSSSRSRRSRESRSAGHGASPRGNDGARRVSPPNKRSTERRSSTGRAGRTTSPPLLPPKTPLDPDAPVSPDTAINVDQLANSLPTAWDSMFHLKNNSFACRMHILRGDESLVDQFLPRRRRQRRHPGEASRRHHRQKARPTTPSTQNSAQPTPTNDNDGEAASYEEAAESSMVEATAATEHCTGTASSDDEGDQLQPGTRRGQPQTPPEEDDTEEAPDDVDDAANTAAVTVAEESPSGVVLRGPDTPQAPPREEREEGEEEDEEDDDDDEAVSPTRRSGTSSPALPGPDKASSLGNRAAAVGPVTTEADEDADSTSQASADEVEDKDEEPICLRITQRMKLDPLKLDDVSQRIRSAGNAGFCVLLAMPAVSNAAMPSATETAEPVAGQNQRPLRNLITYLRTKDSAGVVLLNPLVGDSSALTTSGTVAAADRGPDVDDPMAADGLQITGVLHAFPPCDFSFDLLTQRATHLQKEYAKDNHLVILLIRSSGALLA